jgi:hypothetical protein
MLTQILANTPIWVFVLFFGLLYFGYVQSRTRSLSAGRVAAVPIVLGTFSLYGVYTAFGLSAIAIASWIVGIGLAVLLNRVLKQPSGVTYVAEDRVYHVPGSWIPMALMMTMFFTRYIVTVMVIRNAALAEVTAFAGAICLFYGLLSGTFIARALVTFAAARKEALA